MALEQRFMFDGAALVEAHMVLAPDAGEDHTAPVEAPPSAGATERADAQTANVVTEQSAGATEGAAPATATLLSTTADAPSVLQASLSAAQVEITAFLQAPDALQQLQQLFPNAALTPSDSWQLAADSLLTTGGLPSGPVSVVLLSHAELQGAYGALQLPATPKRRPSTSTGTGWPVPPTRLQ